MSEGSVAGSWLAFSAADAVTADSLCGRVKSCPFFADRSEYA